MVSSSGSPACYQRSPQLDVPLAQCSRLGTSSPRNRSGHSCWQYARGRHQVGTADLQASSCYVLALAGQTNGKVAQAVFDRRAEPCCICKHASHRERATPCANTEHEGEHESRLRFGVSLAQRASDLLAELRQNYPTGSRLDRRLRDLRQFAYFQRQVDIIWERLGKACFDRVDSQPPAPELVQRGLRTLPSAVADLGATYFGILRATIGNVSKVGKSACQRKSCTLRLLPARSRTTVFRMLQCFLPGPGP